MINVINNGFNPAQFPKSKMISVNGIELEVFEAGLQNAGKPIVLCHGFPEHAYSWRHQVPVLVAAGYHVIVPNQRGYGNSSCPTEVTDYDIEHLTGDLVGLLDHYEYENATFIGHDWGANVVWRLAQLHPKRVNKIINLALPYQERGAKPWIESMREVFGEDFYFVHFNQQPGVADTILEENTSRFLSNIFQKNMAPTLPEPGMLMINLAKAEKPLGEPLMSKSELAVFISSFEKSGFSGSINWYRNLDRNWHFLKNVDPIIQQDTLMIYGNRDVIPKFERLPEFVPNVEVASLDCGHCIQQELPEETNLLILKWLEKHNF
ncbi:alpha/beta hydrolase [uncultured Cyclobacterium sp.]|uniref:alpha/beta fold hydrolase n=1 Tax=uncultured Cyclobacterium sp. TaxID=453820 RepID=UPI0030ECA687|tara:strand:+ start:4791 stop:5753 length:963 start_codon:yes stop_codon:yes gene_type:complete